MKFLVDCVKGIAIGSGAILPGISSGVLCVIFGLYERLLNSVLDFFKSPKENFNFLFPIIIGIFIGVLIFSNLINYFLEFFPLQTKSIFIGLILASIPGLIKDTNTKYQFKYSYILYTLFTFFIGILSVFLENNLHFTQNNNFSYIYLILSGFAMSIGIIVPGVSSTIILMLLGIYSTYLSSVSSMYLPILIPMGIGIIFGSIIFMKLTRFMLNKFYPQTFYSIIGFTLGSIIILYPEMSSFLEFILSTLCIVFGFLISSLFTNKT